MPTKSNKKKKSHMPLIISIIAGSIVLLTAIILLITRPWSSNNDSGTGFSFGSDKKTPIKVDDQFVDKIKEHKYQPLKDTRSYSLVNKINTLDYRVKDDGTYNMQIPSEWTDEEGVISGAAFRSMRSRPANTLFNIITEGGNAYTSDIENIDPSKIYSTQDIVDQRIEYYGNFKTVEPEIISQFSKKINNIDYQVLVIKHPDLGDGFVYDVNYIRLLDKGSLTRSFLSASAMFGAEDPESNKKAILEDIYDLEDTIGGFDESKQ